VCIGDGAHLLDAAWQVGVAVVVFGLRVLADPPAVVRATPEVDGRTAERPAGA